MSEVTDTGEDGLSYHVALTELDAIDCDAVDASAAMETATVRLDCRSLADQSVEALGRRRASHVRSAQLNEVIRD